MPSSRRLRLSPAARNDLRDIYRYTARTWSQRQAERYMHLLHAALDGLRTGRRVGRPVAIRAGVLALVAGTHVIFYRQADRSIDVVRVLHQSMDAERHL